MNVGARTEKTLNKDKEGDNAKSPRTKRDKEGDADIWARLQ